MRPVHCALLPALCALLLALALPGPAGAQEGALRALQAGGDSRGWLAVGRLDLGDRGFCTGTLVAPQRVLTAGHCLFDKATGARIPPEQITFRAGWHDGRATAYRGAGRAVIHPDYVFAAEDKLARVAHDLALIELDQPIRPSAIAPFQADAAPGRGDAVGVVSYAQDRAGAPALQPLCHVLGVKSGILVLNCDVDFGSSGAPVFAMRGGVARIVSVVSAKAEVEGRKVALGTGVAGPLALLNALLDQAPPMPDLVPDLAPDPVPAGGAGGIRPGGR